MNKIVLASKTGSFSSESSNGDIILKNRKNPLSSRNIDHKSGLFYKDFRYLDLLKIEIDKIPFSGKVHRDCNYVEWKGEGISRKRMGTKNDDFFMEKISCDKTSEIKITMGFDIKHVYEIVFGRKRMLLNVERKSLSIELKKNVLKIDDGFRKFDIIFSKKPKNFNRRGSIIDFFFDEKDIEIIYDLNPNNKLYLNFNEFKKNNEDEIEKYKKNFIKITVPDEKINDSFNKAVEDLYLLKSEIQIKSKNYSIIFAGMPRFSRLIGRDVLISLNSLIYTNPSHAKDILKVLIATVGKENNGVSGEEPGRIVHDVMHSREYKIPFLYDTSDANALFLIAVSNYVRITGDKSIITDNESLIDSIINWMLKKIESYGFVPSGKGVWLPETSWMDTDDRVDAEYRERGIIQKILVDARRFFKFNMRGGLAPRGTRFPFEMQVQAVKALREIAPLVNKEYLKVSDELEKAIDESFWNGKYYVDLLNRKYHWINSKTSNMIYAPMYNIGRRNEKIVPLLTSEKFIPDEKYGIRTLSKNSKNYVAGSYQSGGVWPYQSYEFARYLMQKKNDLGFEILKNCFVLRNNPGNYLYEVYRGDNAKSPLFSNEIQAWSSSKYIDCVVRGLFGIDNRKADYVTISPYIPENWNEMKLENYKCGAGVLNLHIIDKEDSIELNLNHEGLGLLCDLVIPVKKMPKKAFYKGSVIEYSYVEGFVKINNLKIISGNNIIEVKI
jgi:glycogen debranching enzyme